MSAARGGVDPMASARVLVARASALGVSPDRLALDDEAARMEANAERADVAMAAHFRAMAANLRATEVEP